jgi:hypothetical protein
MFYRIINRLILILILSGCARNSYKASAHILNTDLSLPQMPLADLEVAAEIERVCLQEKCSHLNEWFNKLYTFEIQYEVYRKLLIRNE